MLARPQESGATILVVDDEDEIIQFVQYALEDEGYTVYTACDGVQAMQVARQMSPDLIILDIMMPGTDGFTVCKKLRDEQDIPIIFLSARQSDADKVRGFSLGADDYVMKPFSIRELVARVEAHLRRHLRRQTQQVEQERNLLSLAYGKLKINHHAYEVSYMDEILSLRRKEFEIIQLLVLHPRQVFSREVIYERIWGMEALGNSETVTEHIKRIRRKLARYDPQTEYIATVWGVGYKWEVKT